MHSCGWPLTQSLHAPHCGDQQMTTWWPSDRPVTPGPISTTSPAPSCPRTLGTATGIVPFMADRSEWQTPVALMRTRTLPAPTGVVVTSSRTSSLSSPTLCSTAAFTDSPLLLQEQGALRTRVDGLARLVGELTVGLLDEDVQHLVVVELEHLGCNADAHGVGLALIVVNGKTEISHGS